MRPLIGIGPSRHRDTAPPTTTPASSQNALFPMLQLYDIIHDE
ncbi:hypothetical protein [Halococcus sp. PRR34]|nr:hypothetical protein [Halococcus sp. PRR34]